MGARFSQTGRGTTFKEGASSVKTQRGGTHSSLFIYYLALFTTKKGEVCKIREVGCKLGCCEKIGADQLHHLALLVTSSNTLIKIWTK